MNDWLMESKTNFIAGFMLIGAVVLFADWMIRVFVRWQLSTPPASTRAKDCDE